MIKKFIKKTSTILFIILFVYMLLGLLANGYTDPFYKRFTTSKKSSLILGSSRAAQGIQPYFINKNIDKEQTIYNYSFTILHSPYGEVYYNAIKEKLKDNSVDGLFILDVNPWTISSRKDINFKRETKLELAKISNFNLIVNYDYLVNAYQGTMFNLLFNKFRKKPTMHVEDDGWLKVDISMKEEDVTQRTKSKIDVYRKENLVNFEISQDRIQWLKKTIELLKNYGDVILVRIPVGPQILKIEEEYYSNFDKLISTNFKETSYLNYISYSNLYTYIDGNHLYKKSGKKFSKKLAIDINKLLKSE